MPSPSPRLLPQQLAVGVVKARQVHPHLWGAPVLLLELHRDFVNLSSCIAVYRQTEREKHNAKVQGEPRFPSTPPVSDGPLRGG